MKKSGFTLIEVMVAGSVMMVLGFGVLALRDLVYRNELSSLNAYVNVTQTNRLVSQFVREARQAESSENGAFAFESLEDDEIIFYSDYDIDGVVEKIRYTFSDGQVSKGIIEPIGTPAVYDPVTENVRILTDIVTNDTPLFQYYDQNWPTDTVNNPLVLADRLANTQTIRIFVKVNNRNADNEEYVLNSFVQPRILKSNL